MLQQGEVDNLSENAINESIIQQDTSQILIKSADLDSFVLSQDCASSQPNNQS